MRTYLSRLRSVLPDTAVVSHQSGYRLDLDGPHWMSRSSTRCSTRRSGRCRTSRSTATTRRCALWRDVPFGEFSDEWWALAESSRLVERRILAQEDRAAALIATGHHGRAVPPLEALVAAHPLRERPVRLLMAGAPVTGRQRRGPPRRPSRSEPGSPRRPGWTRPGNWWNSNRRSSPTTHPAQMLDVRPLRGYTILTLDRRGRLRPGLRRNPAGHRAAGRDQGDPSRPRRLDRVRPPVRGRGASSSPAWSTPTSFRSTTSGASPGGAFLVFRLPRRRHRPRVGGQSEGRGRSPRVARLRRGDRRAR